MNQTEKKNLSKFYKMALSLPNNIKNTDWSWIGEGPNPLDYSLLLNTEKDSSSFSYFTIVGTIVLVEKDKYKTLVHLSGLDPFLSDATIWATQIAGNFS
jgi:hypothetical protein